MRKVINVTDPTLGQLDSMTKKQLKAFIASQYQATSEIAQMYNDTCRDAERLGLKLDKAEAYVEQGRAMIESVMDRWHEYDV